MSAERTNSFPHSTRVDLRHRVESSIDETMLEGQKRILERIALGTPVDDVLADITLFVERQIPGALCSILLVNNGGNELHFASGKSLPSSYNQAIARVPIAAGVGSCGTAAAMGKVVIVDDIASDPLWSDYRELALAHGLRSCWSFPVFAPAGSSDPPPVLGTFAIYWREPNSPTTFDLEVVRGAAHFVGITVAQHKTQRALRDSEEIFRKLVDQAADAFLLHDLDGNLVDANRRACEALGYSHAQLMGMSMGGIESSANGPTLAAAQSLSPGERVTVEGSFRRQDGSEFPVETSLTCLELHGKPRVLALARDITDRMRAEEGLRKKTSQLFSIYETTADVIFLLAREPDGGYRFESINPAFTTVTGLPREAVLGRRVDEVIPPPSLDLVLAHYRQAIEQRSVVRWEETTRYPTGTLTGVVSIAPIFAADGRCTHLVGSVHDITERKRVEQELKRSENRFSRLFYGSPFSIMLATYPEGRVVDANEAYLKLFGYRRDEVIGKTTTETLIWDDLNDRAEMLTRLCTDHRVVNAEYRFRTKSREVRWLLLSIELIQLHGETHSLAMSIDITQRRQAEAALRQNQNKLQLFRSLIELSNDAIYVINPQSGRFLDANHLACERLGYTRDELVSLRVADIEAILPDEDMWRRHVAEVRQLRSMLIEGTHRRKDGTTFPTEVNVAYVTVADADYMIAVVRDISDRKRAETSLKRLQQQLHESQKLEAIGRLAGGVAHDFNNLLTVINGYCDLVLAGKCDDQSRIEWLSEVRHAGRRAADLTQQLLAFSRRAMVEPTVLDLNQIIRQLESILRRLVGENIQFVFKLDSQPTTIKADRTQIEQILMNLVVNARDAMPSGGQLTIATRLATSPCIDNEHSPGLVELSVHDSGTGMSEEVQSRIFEPFFTTKPSGEGTGLGLAVVHGIVQQCGGKIEVASQAGRGTTIVITLPTVSESPAAIPSVSAPALRRGVGTILLVEDERGVRGMSCAVLESHGYRVLDARDADDALRMVARESGAIDLLVTDVIMPGQNGRDLAKHLRGEIAGLPVLFISGYTDAATMQQLTDAEGTSFLQKPFSPAALLGKVQSLLQAESNNPR